MKVFISWSGQQAKNVATVLREWLPILNSHVGAPFLSSADIEAGSNWSARIFGELQGTQVGIICMTRENKDRPWINFEAGMLARHVENDASRVVPLLIDLAETDLVGPLSHFQGVNVNKQGIQKIAEMINQQLSEPLDLGTITRSVDTCWPNIEAAMQSANVPSSPPARERPDLDMLGEILQTVRNLATHLNADGSAGVVAAPDRRTPRGLLSFVETYSSQEARRRGVRTIDPGPDGTVVVFVKRPIDKKLIDRMRIDARSNGLTLQIDDGKMRIVDRGDDSAADEDGEQLQNELAGE